MAGYLGAKPVVAQVDGFTKTQSDARYVDATNSDTMNAEVFTIESDITGGYSGLSNYPSLYLSRPTNYDRLAMISFAGLNSDSNSATYATIAGTRVNSTSGSLVGELSLRALSQTATQTFSGITINESISVFSDDTGDTAGPIFNLYRNSSSPADDDYIGKLNFRGRNDASEDVDYSSIDVQIDDASNGSENAITRFINMSGGYSREHMRFNYQETRFNNAGLDQDFIIESDGRYNFFKVDAALNRLIINANSTSDYIF
jgi:hypothetical protein